MQHAEVIAHDWVLDARLLTSGTIGLVTAHNTFVTYSVRTKTFQRRFDCEEQSLLYAAQIHLSDDEQILLATGTVFNEIQIWRPSVVSRDLSSRSSSVVSIARRLGGHEGCIFSLRFDDNGSLLASCSDDRTIRVWNVQNGTFIAIGFAHIARVWDVQFVPCASSEEICLLSASEDTTALLWNLDPAKRRLQVLEKYHGHGGKHVWSEAVSSDGKVAATGGNDGRVNLWDIGGWRQRLGLESSEIFWTETVARTTIDEEECLDNIIKGYRCLDEKQLLVTTNSG